MCYASVAIRDTMMRRGYEESMRYEPHDMREMWIIMDLNDRSLTCLRLPGRHMHKRHDEAEKRGALAVGRIAWKAKRELASCAAGQWHTTRSGCTDPPKQQAHVIPRSYQRISRSCRTARRLGATPYELQRSAHILPKNGLSSERCHHAVRHGVHGLERIEAPNAVASGSDSRACLPGPTTSRQWRAPGKHGYKFVNSDINRRSTIRLESQQSRLRRFV